MWTVYNHSDNELVLDKTPIRFKGGSSSTTTRNIPAQSANESALESGLMNYALSGLGYSPTTTTTTISPTIYSTPTTNNKKTSMQLPSEWGLSKGGTTQQPQNSTTTSYTPNGYGASSYLSQANNAVNSTYNPNWNSLAGNYNNTMSGVNQDYQSLANGKLPTAYTDNITKSLNDMTTSSMGSALSNLASRGIINSSQADAGFANIANSVASAAANKYLDATNTYSGILGNTANNAANQLSGNASAQQNSYYMPSQLRSYADNDYNKAFNLFNTMYSGRMGTGSTSTSTNDGGASTWQAIGGLGSAAILCFVGGTKIATPDGDKNIEDIQIGDKVISLDGAIETVIEVQEPQISPNEYMLIKTKTNEVRPTSTQPLLTTEGDFLPHELIGKELIGKDGNEVVISVEGNQPKETIYDFKTTGANVYFANGFAVRGRE